MTFPATMPHNTSLLTVSDVARQLSVSPRTVQSWAQRGVLVCVRVGAVVRFDPNDVAAFIEANKKRRAG